MLSKNLIYKDNKIIEASYKLTLNEQRIVLMAISQVNSVEKLTENDIFILTADEYSSIFSIDKKESFREMKKAMEVLAERWIKVIEDGNESENLRWISKKAYKLSNQSIGFRFDTDVAKYLSGLTGSFTKYRLHNVSSMTSIYSIRIYEMLMRWKTTKTTTLTVDQIRDRMELTSKGYASFGNIKQKIIDPAMAEIGICSDIDATYELIKKGNKVISVKFDFKFKPGMEPKIEAKNQAMKAIGNIKNSLK